MAADPVITLSYSNFFPATHKNSIIAEEWSRELEKKTNGRVKISYYSGGTLTPAAQTFDSVVKGIADIGNTVLGYTMGKFPLSEVLDYPVGYPSGIVATKLGNAFYSKFKPKEFDGVKILYFHAQGPGILHTKKPVRTLEDLKGMKIRTFGSNAKFASLLGAAPVGTTMPETYDALRTGVAEGAMAPIESLQGWKWGEVIKSTTENYGTGYTATFIVFMNKAKWNSLPPDVQKTIDAMSVEYIEKQGKLWDTIDAEGRAFTLKRGNQIIRLTPEENARWIAKAQPMFDDYVAKTKEKGLPGDAAVKFVRDYIKANTK
jgi:TRAP-type C4-dicarboxylate transport system substrate-binding protein